MKLPKVLTSQATLKSCAKKQGATLLEWIIVIILTAIVAGGVGDFFYQTVSAHFQSVKTTDLQEQGHLALAMLSRDLTNIRSNQADDIPDVAGPYNRITFTNLRGDTINYSVSNNQLLRQINSNTAQVLASDTASLTIRYLNGSGLAVTTLAQSTTVRAIGVQLTLENNESSFTINTVILPGNMNE